jgi:hypothetical protein
MAPGHERYEQLAVGHVLGGLAAADASDFRDHLLGCRPCRARVAELRDLASDLAVAEREERAALRLKTETPTRRELPEFEPAPARRAARVVAVVLTVVLVSVFAVWNAHLRTQNMTLLRNAELREQTLAALGSGEALPTRFRQGVDGVVVADGDRIAYSFTDLPVPAAAERLVVWLVTDGKPQIASVHTARQLLERRLASTIGDRSASRFLVSVEPWPLPTDPTGVVLVEADLAPSSG